MENFEDNPTRVVKFLAPNPRAKANILLALGRKTNYTMAIDRIQHAEKGEVQIRYRRQCDYDDIVKEGFIEVEDVGRVQVFPFNDKRKIVTVRRFPLWVENDVVKEIFSKYGNVLSVDFQKLKQNDNPYMQGCVSGTRVIIMDLEKEIPALKEFRTYKYAVSYAGQAPFCYFCRKMGHTKFECKKLFCRICETQGHKESECLQQKETKQKLEQNEIFDTQQMSESGEIELVIDESEVAGDFRVNTGSRCSTPCLNIDVEKVREEFSFCKQCDDANGAHITKDCPRLQISWSNMSKGKQAGEKLLGDQKQEQSQKENVDNANHVSLNEQNAQNNKRKTSGSFVKPGEETNLLVPKKRRELINESVSMKNRRDGKNENRTNAHINKNVLQPSRSVNSGRKNIVEKSSNKEK